MERDRERAVTEFGRNIAVDASAGTGKTATLIARVTNLFLERKALSPDNVLLLTFTEKAAAEMKSRVAEGWERLLADCRLCATVAEVRERMPAWNPLVRIPADAYPSRDELASRVEAMAERVGRLSATTFHAFCKRILLAFPAEAGVDPKLEVLPGSRASDAWDSAFRLFLRSEFEGSRTDPRWEPLLSRAGTPDAAWRMIGHLVRSQRDLLRDGSLDLGSAGDLLAHLQRSHEPHVAWFREFARRIDEAGHAMAPVVGRALAALSAAWEKIAAGDLAGAEALAAEGAEAFAFPANTVRPSRRLAFPEGGTLAATRDALRELFAALADASAGDASARFLVDRARAADDFYRESKGSNLDFMDLLLRANGLLRGNRAVARRLAERYRYIFVDEFQDTDPLQAGMLDALSAEGPPGRLFLVGDPKQSIYGFRRADIQVYNRFRGELLAADGEEIALVTNFRSRPDLVATINALFSRILSARADFSPPYAPVAARRTDAGVGAPVTLFSLAETVPEPGFLAALVKRIVGTVPVGGKGGAPERPASWRDVAVLYRADTGGEALASFRKAMEEAGVPCVVPSRRGFYARQEVQDLRMVLQAIDAPADPSARYAALKTIFFGLPDEEILPLIRGGEASSRAREADEAIGRLSARRGRTSLTDLVAALCRETGVEFVAARLPEGERIVQNLAKAFALARVFEWEGGGSVKEFLAELRRKTEGDREESEFPSFDEAEDAVRIATIHSAKGLEFPIVVLANLSRGSRRAVEGLRVDRVRGVAAVLFPRMRSFSAFRPIRAGEREATFAQWEREKEQAEERRLLYVAATRARDRLFCVAGGTGQGSELLAALREGISASADAGPQLCGVTGIAGTRRRFPSGAELLEVPVGELEAAAPAVVPPFEPPAAPPPSPPAAAPPSPPAAAPPPSEPVPLREFHDRTVGRLFGEKVHRALEAFPPVIAPWPPAGFLPPDTWGEGEEARWRKIAARIAAAPIHRLLLGGRGAWTELPMLRFAGGRAWEERADLVVRMPVPGGAPAEEYWVVDYKTGEREAAAEAGYLARLREYMEVLCGAWDVPVRGFLWYVETGETVEAGGGQSRFR